MTGSSSKFNWITFINEDITIELCETDSVGFFMENKHRHTGVYFKSPLSTSPRASQDKKHRKLLLCKQK